MTMEGVRWSLALLARQVARAARRNPGLNDAADTLFVACVQMGVPSHLLPQ